MIRIVDVSATEVRVYHPKHIHAGGSVKGVISNGNRIDFEIIIDGEGNSRPYSGILTRIDFDRVRSTIIGDYGLKRILSAQEPASSEQKVEADEASDSELVTDGDGGWVATRPPED